MTEFANGFYTALGTPLDCQGKLISASFARQVKTQVISGAKGLLLLGSMGMQPAVRLDVQDAAISAALDAAQAADLALVKDEPESNRTTDDLLKAKKAVALRASKDQESTVPLTPLEPKPRKTPILVGVMDNSVARVLDRVKRIDPKTPIAGVVVTTPYYFVTEQASIRDFFLQIAEESPFPVFLYDLPVATKIKITFEMVEDLWQHPNIAGIKTGDLILCRKIKRSAVGRSGLAVFYSGLDLFDTAESFGIHRHLDGMFAATPRNARKMEKAFADGDVERAGRYLDRIVGLRDLMAHFGIFPAFTRVMNLLGFEGDFGPDYLPPVDEEASIALRAKLVEIKELKEK